MADEEKHHVVRTLKREYDENASKLRQASRPRCGDCSRSCQAVQRHQGGRCRRRRLLIPPLPLGLLPSLQLESQKRMVESTLRRAAFTAAQLDEMPGDVATYRSVGKA